MKNNLSEKIKLNNGIEIPRLGLGTYAITNEQEIIDSILFALKSGYRLIDTAASYYNEEGIGKAIKKSNIKREEIFITTKLADHDHGYDKALGAFEGSLRKLGTDYIDLYLIHWPASKKRDESWKALEKIYSEGKCRSIGVSNYTIRHLNELFDYSSVVPVVNQVEFSPYLYQKDLLEFCETKGIKLEAYTPLARGKKMNEKVIQKLSKKYSKTPAQIFLLWILKHDVIAIPKSSNRDRIKENFDIFDFEISDEDMKIMNTLDEGYRLVMDPEEIS